MKKETGIPRALSYYNNYPFYKGFFDELGIKVILSDKTTTKLINDGSKFVVSDTCLPIKVFMGHVNNLIEKGVENIFVPSIQSIGYKINNCSKIRALPDIVRNTVKKKIRIIEPVLDKTENIGIFDFCTQIANSFEIYDKKQIKKAMENGFSYYNNFLMMTQSGIPYIQALNNSLDGIFEKKNIELVRPISLCIMGHGYNLFDERISLNLIKKLEKMNIKVYTSLDVPKDKALFALNKTGEIQYWANELELTGVAAYCMQNKKIDGIIALSTFGCGPDSLMVNEINYHAKDKKIPMIHLTIDEHTGEAGFVTRIEAFVDMITRSKKQNLIKKQELKPLIKEKQTEIQAERYKRDK